MSSEDDGVRTIHYDEWLPFECIAPEDGARVDLRRWCNICDNWHTLYDRVWPQPGRWHYWRRL